ncbi:MAG: hypothetical protein AAF384_09750 [Pseudomonadota bacterium]
MNKLLSDRRLVLGLAALALVSISWNILMPLIIPPGDDLAEVPAFGFTEGVVAPGNHAELAEYGIAVTGRDGSQRILEGVDDWGAGRDPFSFPGAAPRAIHTKPALAPGPLVDEPLELTAVVITSSFRRAVIDGRSVAEGDQFDGRTVMRIDDNGVALQDRNGTLRLMRPGVSAL